MIWKDDMPEPTPPFTFSTDDIVETVREYEACRRIREQPWGNDITIVAATGWGQEEDHRRSKEAGFDHHLVKPVDAADIMGLLAKARP